MTEFNIAATTGNCVLRDLVALEGGGFAALMQDTDAITRAITGTRIVIYAPGAGGGMEKVGADIVLGTISPSVSMLALSDGGLALYQRSFVTGVGNVTLIRSFDSQGQETGLSTFSGTLGLSFKLDASIGETFSNYFWRDFDASLPTFTVRRVEDDTGLMTDVVISLPEDPMAAIDAGFMLISNESFTKLIGVAINSRNDETPPVYDGWTDFTFQTSATAGNNVVLTDVPAPLVLVGGELVQRGRVDIKIARPDGSPAVTVFSDARDNARFGAVVVEVPGIGFAAFVSAVDSLSGATFRADLMLFSFDGLLLGQAQVAGPIGDRDIAPTMRLVALDDPLNAQVKIVASWGDDALATDALAPRQQAELFTFDIAEGPDGFAISAGGTNYSDFLRGLGLKDHINGGLGDDLIVGNGGDDLLLGGAGNDAMAGGEGNDSLSGQEGRDVMRGEGGADTLGGGGGDDLLLGEEGDDILRGGNGKDTLLGADGADSLEGQAGNDSLVGNSGDDTLFGGDGADTLTGGVGDDFVIGDAGNDSLLGIDGNDTLAGQAGDDAMFGGRGQDQMVGQEGNDSLQGGNDDDRLLGHVGNDLLRGDAGNDQLQGGNGKDTLFGGGGQDRLTGGAGRDLLIGGPGADLFIFATVVEAGNGAARDRISDFTFDEDQIDLRAIDPDFSFISGAFTAGGGAELRYQAATGLLQGDVDGDGLVDFAIELLNKPAMPTGAFLL